MGAAPAFFPGQARFDDPGVRDRFATAWEASLPPVGSGAHLIEILKRCKSGQIKALYMLGENPLATLPASMEVRAALERLELLVVQDPFLTDTGKLAHFVLPACTYAEKDGTFTNLEGRVLRVRQAMDPLGESLPDWHIMTALANAMGCRWEYQSANDIQAEIMKLLPGYYNLGQPRKVVPDPDQYLSNGYAAEVKARYQQTSAVARAHASFFPGDGTVISAFGEIVDASVRAYQDRSEHREVADEYTGHGTSRDRKTVRRCVYLRTVAPFSSACNRISPLRQAPVFSLNILMNLQ